MKGEIDLHGKWVGISTLVMPDKLGFMIHPTKKHFYREMGNKFGSYDHITVRPKSTYDKDNKKIVMWEISSSYFGDKVFLKDSKILSCILDRNNYSMLDDMFYYRSLKNGGEVKNSKSSQSKKSMSNRYIINPGSFTSLLSDDTDFAFRTYSENLRTTRAMRNTESLVEEPQPDPQNENVAPVNNNYGRYDWYDYMDLVFNNRQYVHRGTITMNQAGEIIVERPGADG